MLLFSTVLHLPLFIYYHQQYLHENKVFGSLEFIHLCSSFPHLKL